MMSTPGHWMMLRSLSQDSSIKHQRLKPGTLKRIASFAKPYKWWILVFLITVLLDAVLTVSTPLFLRRLIDQGIVPKNRSVVVTLAIVVGVLAILDAAVSTFGRWFSVRIGEGLIYDLRTQVFAHVQRQPLAFFVRSQTGALISRLNSDVIGAQQAFTGTLSNVVSNGVSLALVLSAMFYLSWQVTIVSLIIVPLFILPSKWIGRQLQRLTRIAMNLNADLSSAMVERFNVSGALLVSLFGNEAREHDFFRSRARKVADTGIKTAMLNRYFINSLTLIASVATAITYGLGGSLAISGSITLGTVLALTALLGRLYGPLTALSNVRVEIMTALVSFERVFEILDLKPLIRDRPTAREIPNVPGRIEFKDVSFTYPSAHEVSLASLESIAKPESMPTGPVLENITFSVLPGTMTALVGPSGAGKTTLATLLPRLYDVSSGAIYIDGVDIRDVTLESLRNSVGMVTQDAHLFHDSILANLQYAKPEATLAEIAQACKAGQIWNLIESLPDGLSTVVGDRGHRLSGGEKQRLAIARLLLKAPSMIVLDEATAHLDSENEALVQEALKAALANRTSLVIAHRLSTVREADQILVISDGRIAEQGVHEQLLDAGGLYSELYRRQFAER
jgi:ATP-binding cassette subfamily B protein